MILSLPLNMMIFWQSLSCAAATVLLFFLFKASLHRSSGRLHWFLAVRIDKDSINHCNVWICVILTIGHPERFLHATHLGNILSNIPLFATNRPGLPVGTPVVGASKQPQSYTMVLLCNMNDHKYIYSCVGTCKTQLHSLRQVNW